MEEKHEMFIGLHIARGIAALFVVLFHANLGSVFFYGKTAFSGFWKFGIIGVDFFFVLSGFIIYWIHSEDEKNFESSLLFLKKRIIKIYPPFILISIISLISYKIFPNLSAANRNIGIITSIFLFPTPPLDPALTISWTLMHQMMFYIIFITIYIKKTLFHITFILWGLMIVFFSFIPFEGIIKTFFFNPYNLQFLIGIIAAKIIISDRDGKPLIYLGFIMLLFFIYTPNFNIEETLIFYQLLEKIYLGLCFMFIIIGLTSINTRIKYPKFLISLGSASYSIYLIHNPVISILNRIAFKVHGTVAIIPEILFIIISGLCILAGLLYYVIFEKPISKVLHDKFLSSSKI